MTASHPDNSRLDSLLGPPPGCPAHGLGPDGLRRLYGPEADADPRGLYAKLRAEYGAVAPVLVPGDFPAWIVLGHSENLEAMRNPSRFSHDSRRWREMREGRVPPDSPLLAVVTWQPMCSFLDGEGHERLRAAVTDSMDRFDSRGMRRHVTRFANQLIDDFAGEGLVDIVDRFAQHLPMLTMTQLLGMPEEYGPRLVDATRDMMQASPTALASNEYLVKTLRQLVDRKRAEPANDFASWLLTHPAELDDDEAVEQLRMVLIASYETTANLIATTLLMVVTDPRFRSSLAGGSMTLPNAVEQVLWDTPPFARVYGRWATGDTVFAGQHIKAGDMLVLGLAAANCDPVVRPDLNVPMHGNRSHLAFSGGPHECPGQDIGRAITEVGIDALLMRLPDARLAVPEEELRWEYNVLSRRLMSLPLEFTPPRSPSHPESVWRNAAAAQSAPADGAMAGGVVAGFGDPVATTSMGVVTAAVSVPAARAEAPASAAERQAPERLPEVAPEPVRGGSGPVEGARGRGGPVARWWRAVERWWRGEV
ncbi:cytochrome P450 [Streptantibioticus parmotrematis]|uniref:cytochrome P450 n=1 Tax=Streptantibioticus parmotrematis TaxID=2873249 RepID=UPI0033F19DA0